MTLRKAGDRKPRVAIMGEFSAGKSTLTNFLLGTRALPEKVTATRLPPVWMSQGAGDPYRVLCDGTKAEVKLDRLEDIPLEETRVIRLFFDAGILESFDLIDFPGISDPNMSSEVWERMVSEVDAVIWCTHATQAWRQSETAAWDSLPENVRNNSILLVTRIDKLTNERDKSRVLNRVIHEAGDQFGAIVPISLLQALAAEKDKELWAQSGAENLVLQLDKMIKNIDLSTGRGAQKNIRLLNNAEAAAPQTKSVSGGVAKFSDAVGPKRVLPRRVKAQGGARTLRPPKNAD